MKQYVAIDDTVYFWFAGNDTSGSGGDGASPAADVRLAGAAADAAPTYSPTPTLLSHVNYPAGAYEIAITASAANGFAAGNTYAVFCTLAIDSQNPTGFVGSFDTKPVESNPTQLGDSAQSLTDLKDFADDGYNPATHYAVGVTTCTTTTTNTDMRGTDNAALAATALSDVMWTDAKAGALEDWLNGGRLDLILDIIAADTTTDIPALIATAQADLNLITGADGVTLATAQALYAPNVVVPDVAGTAATPAEVATALTDIHLDHLLAVNYDPAAKPGVATALLNELVENDGGISRYTANALEQAPSGGAAPTVTEIRQEMDSNSTRLSTIAADTTTDIPALIATAQADLDLLTGADGVTLATLQANYAPNVVVPDAAGVAPTAVEIRQEMDTNSTKMAPSQTLDDYKATGFNTVVPDAAGVAATPAEVAAALVAIHLDHLLAVDYDPASKPGVATALLNELVENDGGVSRYTANALEQAPSGGTNPNVLVDTTIATVTDQTHIILTAGSSDDDAYKDQSVVVYDASNSDYPSVRKCSAYAGATKTVTLDSAPDFTMVNGDGARVFVTAPGTTAPTVGQIRVEMDSNSTRLSAIETDTTGLNGDAMRGTDSAALAATALTDVTWTDAKAAALEDWLNGGRLDLILDIVAADTTTDIPALIATAQADLDMITGADGVTLATLQALYAPNVVVPDAQGVLPTAAENADALWDELLTGSSHNIPTSAGRRLREASDLSILRSEELAQAGTISSITLNAAASSQDMFYDTTILTITGGTGAGQARTVDEYTGSTRVATICRDWVIAPDNTSTYIIRTSACAAVYTIGVDALALINAECDLALSDYDPPTRAEATTDKDAIITEVNANETKIDALQTDSTAIKAKTDNLPSGIQKNVALSDFTWFMVLASDHVTAAAGKTLTGTISKDGGAFGAVTNAIAEIGSGMYKLDLTQTEMNADVISLKFTETDCDQRVITIYTT